MIALTIQSVGNCVQDLIFWWKVFDEYRLMRYSAPARCRIMSGTVRPEGGSFVVAGSVRPGSHLFTNRSGGTFTGKTRTAPIRST